MSKEALEATLSEISFERARSIQTRKTLATITMDNPRDWIEAAIDPEKRYAVSFVTLDKGSLVAEIDGAIELDRVTGNVSLSVSFIPNMTEMYGGALYNALAIMTDREDNPQVEQGRIWKATTEWPHGNFNEVTVSRMVERKNYSPRDPLVEVAEFAGAFRIVTGGAFDVKPRPVI